MKKIIGTLGIALIAAILMFNTSQIDGLQSKDVNLADLMALNTANAECGPAPSCSTICYYSPYFYCTATCPGAPPLYCPQSVPFNP